MTETVQIAIISAGSGIVGALFGAAGAVLGPWWLKKTEIKAEREKINMEARRRAIVEYANNKMDAMKEYHQVFSFGAKSETLTDKINEANKSATELYSRIKKEDAAVKDWINKMSFRAFSAKLSTIKDLIKIDAFLSIGIQYLIAWHVGELSIMDLKPYGLDKNSNPVWLDTWKSPWPE